MSPSLRRMVLAFGLAIAACSGPPPRRISPPPRPSPIAESETDDLSLAVVELHNGERARRNLPPLAVSEPLHEAAERQARDMASRGRMTHRGSDGTSPMDRIKDAGFVYQRAGENVAYGQLTPEEVTRGWMNSPPHRRNILGAFTRIGSAYAIAKDGTSYWCVTFGTPMSP